MQLLVDEIASFLPDQHFVIASDSRFCEVVGDFANSAMKVCSIDLNFESLETNVGYLLNQLEDKETLYFYAPLRKTDFCDVRTDYRIKRFLLCNEPNINTHVRHPLIRRRRFFKEHWMLAAENYYIIVLKNSAHLRLHTRFLLSNLIDYPTCKLILIDELKNE
jgi:hypothetical protein